MQIGRRVLPIKTHAVKQAQPTVPRTAYSSGKCEQSKALCEI